MFGRFVHMMMQGHMPAKTRLIAGLQFEADPAPLQVFAWQMCSHPKLDSHRFKSMIEEGIELNHVKRCAA